MKIIIDTGVKYCPYCKYRLFDIDLILGICGMCLADLPSNFFKENVKFFEENE